MTVDKCAALQCVPVYEHYHRPTREQRIVMFLDIADPTAFAEPVQGVDHLPQHPPTFNTFRWAFVTKLSSGAG
jgi:hypothetical protein